jgi:hypothetical protein
MYNDFYILMILIEARKIYGYFGALKFFIERIVYSIAQRRAALPCAGMKLWLNLNGHARSAECGHPENTAYFVISPLSMVEMDYWYHLWTI